MTAYILASTVSAPLYGKLGDLYGRRNMVFVSVGLFLVGSMACGAAQSMTQLILARALQGLGGGGLFVLALSVVGEIIPPRQRGRVQGVFAAAFSVASVIGPLVGGWFVEVASWHWIFYFNVPIGALAVAIFASFVQPHRQPPGPPDRLAGRGIPVGRARGADAGHVSRRFDLRLGLADDPRPRRLCRSPRRRRSW